MPTPLLKRIYQLPSLTTPITQLAGGYLVWDVPLGPVAGGYKSYKGTAEELAAYLRNQGLLASETAALVAVDAAAGALIYEAPKGLTQAEVDGLTLAITTAPGTNVILPTTVHVGLNSLGTGTTYDSATGWLYIVLPTGTAPTDVLSAHLCRITAGVEQILAADLNPFGGGSSLATIDLLDLTPAFMNAVMGLTYTDCDAAPADSPAGSFPGQQFDALHNGHNCHFYCTRGTYDPSAPAGTTGQGPAWHYTVKQA